MTLQLNQDKRFSSQFKPLSDETSRLINPILRKKLGLTVELLENWPEIVGMELAQDCQPLKIIWPRRRGGDNHVKPATLVIGCEGVTCLKVQHSSHEIIQRLQMFFGFFAIDKIKIERRKIIRPTDSRSPRPLREEECAWLEDKAQQIKKDIKDESLRACLLRLGRAIITREEVY